jgi:hypothetical protein
MSVQEVVGTIVKPGSAGKWLRVTIAAVVMSAIAFIGFIAPASAEGATQIAGVGYFAEAGECTDSEGNGSDLALTMTGDLEGCLYIFVETFHCSPSGMYHETGTETFVDGDGAGTFETTYRFTAKMADCPDLATELWGRCQHPIVAGSGTGIYEGVTGRFNIEDDVAAVNFPYTGHLKW